MKKLSIFCAFCFVLSTFAYTSEDLMNANSLADQGIITKQTIDTKYRLDDKILRQEVIGMALKIKGITLPENYQCKKYFADASQNNWECRAVELAADNGIISRSNKYANPGKYVTRAEGLAMIMKAGNIQEVERKNTDEIFDDANIWQSAIIYSALHRGLILPKRYNKTEGSMLKTHIVFYPNKDAFRSEVFGFSKSISEYKTKKYFDKTYSNDVVSFQYASQFHNSYTNTLNSVTVKETENTINLEAIRRGGIVPNGIQIKYYQNIYSDIDILNILGYTENESCKKPSIIDREVLKSGGITFSAKFGEVYELCGINAAWKGIHFPKEGILIYILLGQDGAYEILNKVPVKSDYPYVMPDTEQTMQNFFENFKVVQ